MDDHDPTTPIGYKTFEQRSLPPLPAAQDSPPREKVGKTKISFVSGDQA